MYNDIVTIVGRCNSAMLALHDVSAAFGTTNHDNMFFSDAKN